MPALATSKQPRPVPVMRSPRTVDVELTSRCNLRCTYCYYFDNPAVKYEDLPAQEWVRFFEECGEAGVMDATLAGGEPFIRKDLPEILRAIAVNRMRFALLSNGCLIRDEIAEVIAGTGRCDYVQVSIDGSRAEVHDSCRGQGAFEKAVRGLKTLQEHGIRAAVRVTIHRHNVDDLENIARFLLEDLGLSGFGTNSAGYLGSCRVHSQSVMLTTADRQRAIETLLRLNEKYEGRINAAAGPLAEGRMWRKMEDARLSGAAPFPNGGHLTACGCHNSKLAVRADGGYVVCNMLPHLELGWINRDSLLEVWQKHPALTAMRRRHEISLRKFDECRGCSYVDYCTGNCPALAYNLTGEVDHPSPDACLRQFLRDGGAVPDLPVKVDA